MPEPSLHRRRLRIGLAEKLALFLVVSTAALFSLFGYLNLRLQRRQAQEMVLQSAERISDVIRGSTHYQMLRNDRQALYHVIQTIGGQPGIRRIRIFNKEGLISVSTDPAEVGTMVNKGAEACYGCHSQSEPLARLSRPDRWRIFTGQHGGRVLGVIQPIENEPACANAACHAHPAEQRILGVIDTDLSLAPVDAQVTANQGQLVRFTAVAVVLVSLVSVAFIVMVVHRPIKELAAGTLKVARGDMEYRLPVRSSDELGDLAASFNKMTGQLAEAHADLTQWARMLETRVEEKTRELKRAHAHMLQVEKMASLGKLAAVVAHEINNPLAGILTYTKLLKKWLAQQQFEPSRQQEIASSLDLVENESRRCGDIVKNLLTFARAAPMNLQWANLNAVVERVVRLVSHQLELTGIQLQQQLAPDLPAVHCDAAQVEQVLLALVLNAVDALPHGGTLCLRSQTLPAGVDASQRIQFEIEDDGVGIPPDALPHIFEPFFSTKESGRSVGLGLAVSHGIVERHGGTIDVVSELGRGARFTITLPVESALTAPDPREFASAKER